MLSLQPAGILAILGVLCVYGARHLEQPEHSITKTLSKTARLECVVFGVTISALSIYWYQERPGRAMEHLLSILADDTVNLEPGITVGKFEVDKIPETSTSTLTIHNVEKQDSATYYCAFLDVHSSRLSESSQSINDLWFFIHYYELENHIICMLFTVS
uniref:T cell receptor gamma variable 9 n=1 Tax=Sciurus vulgaris TaxID=55149 RepID=A0A8D2DRG5_SCIVU